MSYERIHILVVDDEALVAMTVAETLREEGFRVTVAHDGHEALAVEKRDPSDLLVTDLRMPRLDGNQLIALVRAERPDMPILDMSGYSYVYPTEAPDRLVLLRKPFNANHLVRIVHDLLKL
ncbi:hypothetical protein TSH7_02770 [Azospirillum sp. TSH7]|uniref:response regulator n=1 Tax=unclassified Azospirillum TaxID=2630922 RepID=UPI000D61187A|nr:MULTISPECIES: response regulator [unclassified Azospirillum]PWC67020.1 hypothetical protein TSH20_13430 [Azospirillum sp. TSH20]PWC68157.1 hypothetical protein TSH7_02770 [Azospirillum sp. TSH7]